MCKRILAIFIIALLCFNIVQPVFAIQGFGGYKIIEDGGKIKVIVDTKGETMASDRNRYSSSFDTLFAKYGKTLAWFTGIATITLVIIWVVTCVRLAFMASEHWMLRRQLTFALLWIGIATALMGSATLVLTLFQHALV